MTKFRAYKLTAQTIDTLRGTLGGKWKRVLIKDDYNEGHYKYVAVELGSIALQIYDYQEEVLFDCMISENIKDVGSTPIGWRNDIRYKDPVQAVKMGLKKAQRKLLEEINVLNKNVEKMIYLKRSNQFQSKIFYKLV